MMEEDKLELEEIENNNDYETYWNLLSIAVLLISGLPLLIGLIKWSRVSLWYPAIIISY